MIVKAVLERKLNLAIKDIISRKYKSIDKGSLKVNVNTSHDNKTIISISAVSEKGHKDTKSEKKAKDKMAKRIGKDLLKKFPKLLRESEREAGYDIL